MGKSKQTPNDSASPAPFDDIVRYRVYSQEVLDMYKFCKFCGKVLVNISAILRYDPMTGTPCVIIHKRSCPEHYEVYLIEENET